jgi:RNA polymerase sigma-70 factor (ECF subfamily)
MIWRKNELTFEHFVQKRISSLGLIGLSPADSRHKAQTDQKSDAEIIRLVLDGDVNSFEHLIHRHRSRVFGIVSRHVPTDDIEEVAHEVFIRAFKSLSGFRHESNFQHWLSSIAVRSCHDFWRNRYRSREVTMSGLSLPHQKWLEHIIAEESTASFTEEINRKEAGEIVRWALTQLPEKDKTVLELIYFQDYSMKEAAELLGWRQTTVKVRAFRSRQKLQKILRDAMKPNSEEI